VNRIWMGALLLAFVGCPGCPPPDEGCDGGTCTDGGPDGGYDGGGCMNGFCTFTLDSRPMHVLSDFTPQISAALGPNDRIGIAYFNEDAGTGPDGGLDVSYAIQYLEWQNGQVTVGPEVIRIVHNVSGVSVAFQGNGQPAVAYLGGERDDAISVSWWQHDAALAYRSGSGTWTEQIAAVNSGDAPAGNPVSDNGFIMGLYPGLVFDGATAYLVYRDVHYGQSVLGDYDGSDFELASGGPTAWNHRVLIPGGNNKRFWGGHPHLIMGNGRPAVVSDRVLSLPAAAGQDVLFQRRADGGTAWSSPPVLVATAGDTTSGPALAWESGEHFGVAWADRLDVNGQGLFFSETPLTGGAFLGRDPVVQSGSTGWYPSLAFDPGFGHDPVIAYYVCSVRGGVAQLVSCPVAEDELAISRRTGMYWYPTTVDLEGALQPKLFYLSTGKRVIVYKDPKRGTVRIAVEQ